jgi:hypothetical protein
MTRRADLLAARRELLLARCACQRTSLQYDAAVIGNRLRRVDTVTSFARSDAGRTALVGGVIVLVLVGPMRLVRVASRLVAAWSIVSHWIPPGRAR